MNILQALFKSSIGKKVIMAVTGLILFGFVIGHLIGNLQIFSPPEKINEYAHFLQSLGPVLWAVRLLLLAAVGLHIWMAVLLVLENKAARPKGYANQRTLKASYASRTMKYSGLIVFFFIVYHILHFTVKSTHGGHMYPTTMLHGEQVADVHSMMVLGFQQTEVAIFYLIAVALLSWHLSHGFSSMFQSIGIRSRAMGGCLNKLAVVIAILYFLGNAAIVTSVMTGYVTVQNPALAATCPIGDCVVCESTAINN